MKFSTSIRHAAFAGALVAVGTSVLALPAPASAAPAPVAQTRRVADPVADEANRALALLTTASETGDSSVQATYEHVRAEIAGAIADRIGLDAAQLNVAWAKADVDHQKALMAALGQMGVPYRRNSSKPGVSFDCSGLTTYAWSQAGFALQRSSSSQIRSAARVTPETAQAGDLVQYPGHVMMWLGVDRAIVHSPQSGRTVEVDVLSNRHRLRFGDPTV
jgi:cell wall-associated NlpC family hydrolase